MSDLKISTRRLEPVLRALAKDDDLKVSTAAARHLPKGEKLADFIPQVWAWLKQNNMGNRSLSDTRINAALDREPVGQSSIPATKARIERAMERTILRPAPRPPAPAAPDSAPNKAPAGAFDPDNHSDLWLKRPRRPRANAVAFWRERLVAIANGDKAALEGAETGAWWTIRKKWFGTSRPAPARVERFLAWYDAGVEKPAHAAIAQVKHSPAAAAGSSTPSKPSPRATSPAGWQEIKTTCGGCADYYARYSGSASKMKRLAFTKKASNKLRELGFEIGKFLRIYWHPERRELALSLAPAGFQIRAGKFEVNIAGAALPVVLGDEPIEFLQLTQAEGFDLVLGEKAGDA
jgi:hypothetical protein